MFYPVLPRGRLLGSETNHPTRPPAAGGLFRRGGVHVIRKAVLLGSLLLLGAVWLAGCSAAREGSDFARPILSEQVKQASVAAANVALNDVVAKVNSGNAPGSRQAYQSFDTAFGEVLATVGFTNADLAKRLSNANEVLRDMLLEPHPDKASVAKQSRVLAELLRQASAPPVSAKASAQLGRVAQATRNFTVHATEYKFTPAVIEVPKGTRVRIRLVNDGTEEHEFELDAFDFEIKPIKPGTSAEGEFVADKPGTYEYACHVDGHAEKGMIGFLIVK